MKRIVLATLALAVLVALPAMAGEYHSGQTLFCYDCHTPHHSMQHGWDGGAVNAGNTLPNGGNFAANGFGYDWMPAGGPNQYLLKLPPNELCLACHSDQTFAPDVWGENHNAGAQPQGRNAGALNGSLLSGTHSLGSGTANAALPGYADWKGHSLGSTATPPGYNPANIGASDWYVPASGLECINCHAQHGPATSYRNLGSYGVTGLASSAVIRPTYYFSTTVDGNTTKDVRINLASYTAGSGSAATFTPYYDQVNIQYQKSLATTTGSTKTSNRIDTFCATCHGDFHGGTGDTNIGGGTLGTAADGFLRHPTAQQNIGDATAGGHSKLTGNTASPGYVQGVAKVPVYTNDHVAYTQSSPGCVSCHKAHGNQNPFGLLFTAQGIDQAGLADPTKFGRPLVTNLDEEGAWEATQTMDISHGQRNLCGQCHSQGND
jgi:hypothetical protein